MSEAASGYERQDLEKYYTPAWVTEALCEATAFDGPIFDPASGGWHIVEAMRGLGLRCDGNDIDPEPAPGGQSILPGRDFLQWDGRAEIGIAYPNIVTNPPFGSGGRLAVKFIDHALRLTKPHGGKIAMLLRVDFDSAGGRRRLFADHPAFAAKFTLTRRIRWANLPQSAAGPTQNHAWFVWSWAKDPLSLPTIGYLPVASAA